MFNRHVNDKLDLLLDGQLKQKDKIFVESHLKTCALCEKQLKELILIRQKLKTWRAPELDSSFDDRLMNAIVEEGLERENPMKNKFFNILVPAGAIAGVFLVFMMTQTYLHRGFHGKLMKSANNIGEHYRPYISNGSNNLESMFQDNGYVGYSTAAIGHSPKEKTYVGLKGDESKRVDDAFVYQEPEKLAGQDGGAVIVIQPSLPGIPDAEKLIRSAIVTIEIIDGDVTYKNIAEVCKEFGGYLSASRFYKDDQGRQAGTVTMRVPKEKFEAALERLGSIGKIQDIQTDSQDVSRQYASLKTELDAAMVVYNKMLEALNKRQATIPDAIRMESELTPILRRVENLKNQIESLNNSVSLTTITVNFHEANVSVKTLKESTKVLRESLIATGISAIKFLAAMFPILLVAAFLIGGILVLKKIIKKMLKKD